MKTKKQPKPEGHWDFTYGKKSYSLPGRFVQDDKSASDDGKRWIAAQAATKVINDLVYGMAQGRCEMNEYPATCWKYAPRDRGHAHHVRHKKMGNAFGDDRIWINIDGERTQIRIWGCPTCHRHHHNHLHWGAVENNQELSA